MDIVVLSGSTCSEIAECKRQFLPKVRDHNVDIICRTRILAAAP